MTALSQKARVLVVRWAAAGLVLVLAGASGGCTRPNPAYRPRDAGIADVVPGPTRGPCATPGDCQARYGPPACTSGGTWQCLANACLVACPGCTTDRDLDGYGTEPACAGLDCDDADPRIGLSDSRDCYTGPEGTEGAGVCHGGTQVCRDGRWSACLGEVTPAPREACNGQDDDCSSATDENSAQVLAAFECGIGECRSSATACIGGHIGVCLPGPPASAVDDDCDGLDDDCDGAVDEECLDGCIRVQKPGGNDQTADGSAERPFLTIQKAIDFAAARAPARVCVAASPGCEPNTYAESPRMRDGVSVYGNYDPATWTRCPLQSTTGPSVHVTLRPTGTGGIEFPATITQRTILDGFRLNPIPTSTTSASISVSGAREVILSNLILEAGPSVAFNYGIMVTAGANPLITRSAIFVGDASEAAAGIVSIDSSPVIRENCPEAIAGGQCRATCAGEGPGIRGPLAQTPTKRSSAIALERSPGARIEQSAVCLARGQESAAVRVSGDADGVVISGNSIVGGGGMVTTHGIFLRDCEDTAPWIVGNALIEADSPSGATNASGIESWAGCHPVIDSNGTIAGGAENGANLASGISCSTQSRCLISGNQLIQGAALGQPTVSTAVRCDEGCGRITQNILRGEVGRTVTGLWITSAGPLVDRNMIVGGCGIDKMRGALLEDAYARLENNVIVAGTCASGSVPSVQPGLEVRITPGSANEVSVHSNTILGGTAESACMGVGLLFGVSQAGDTLLQSRGVFRNNIFHGGSCMTRRYGIWEDSTDVNPRVLENNDLFALPATTGTSTVAALYRNNNASDLTNIAAVNGLRDGIELVSGNIDAIPLFVVYSSDLHLQAGSLCANAGSATDAPLYDYDGRRRDATPDIGAFERAAAE